MSLKTRNPWGVAGGYDLQRSDLWVVDLREASLSGSQTLTGSLVDVLKSYFPDQMGSLNLEELPYAAYSVSFPDLAVGREPFRRSSTPFPMPGEDTPVEGVRIVFRHSSGVSSPTYTLLELWKELARLGRMGYGNEGTLLRAPNFTSPFRFDLPIRFYAGAITGDTPLTQIAGGLSGNSSTNTDFNNLSTIFGDSSAVTLQPSASYILKRCWVSSLQLTELSHNVANEMVGIQALLSCQYIFDSKNILNSTNSV